MFRNDSHKDAMCHLSRSAIKTIALIAPIAIASMPMPAAAAVRIGNTELNGYTPDEMVNVDSNSNLSNLDQLPSHLETIVILVIRYMLPLMAIGAVCVIVYNAVANMFFRAEPTDNSDPTKKKKVPMKKVIKDIFVGFFFVLFSWIIVELILYFIIGGELVVGAYLS